MFAKEGAKVVLVSRTAKKLQAVQQEIKAAGGQAAICAGDVAAENTNQTMVQTAVDTFGKLDVVFVNAGSLAQKPIVDVTEADIDTMFGHNVKSVVFAMKYAFPAMKEGGKGSFIVNTSCMGSTARVDFAGTSLYAASKAAVSVIDSLLAIRSVI